MSEKKPLVILTGPTAVGKTELSIELAKAVNGSIISADSMQVYKYMDIGSAKVTTDEMCGIKHYLIDCLEPSDEFNVVVFKRMAEEALKEIYSEGKLPIIVGGTGFYIQALLNDIDFTDCAEDTSYREELEAIAGSEGGVDKLHEMLEEIDPKSAETIHKNNVKRTIRALEYYKLTGERISDHNEQERRKESAYNSAYFVLNLPRPILYERIDNRVDMMIEAGLESEVRLLLNMGCSRDMVSMQGLGYKEMIDYINGKSSLDEAIYTIKRDTRHFAKRQLTWFGRERDVIWINKQEHASSEEILGFMLKILRDRQIFV